MPKARIFDMIPFSLSGETGQNSEPSLAVDPLDPTQIIAGAFRGAPITSYFKSTNGGTAWFDDGSIDSQDKSLAWKTDGSGAITTTLLGNVTDPRGNVINTFFQATGGTGFGNPINTFTNDNHFLDQPWVRTGPSNHVYVGYNDLKLSPGANNAHSAFMLVSVNGGLTYNQILLDRVGAGIQDNPSIREAVDGSTVYDRALEYGRRTRCQWHSHRVSGRCRALR